MPPSGTKASLRLEQKTSGLFDSVKAGNETVAGKASTIGLDLMDALSPQSPGALVPGEALGGLFQDMPLELTEADYLDSFMDLSNFLMPEELKETKAVVTGFEFEETKEEMVDFSGLQALLNPEPVTVQAAIEQPPAPSSTRSRKRKTAESLDLDTVCQETPAGVYDHDYVSKKLRTAAVEGDVEPAPTTSTTTTTGRSGNKKYRERRDKNNVASRRSRQIRKQKFKEMDKEADILTSANEKLRQKIEELEGLAKIMKAELIKKMTDK